MALISKPNKQQVINSVERVVAVFIVTSVTAWQANGSQFNKSAGLAAGAAGITAVYQAAKSLLTSL